MIKKLRVGVLASGGGTDLQSIIDDSENSMIDAEVVVVISDKKDAFALKRAEKHGIQAHFVDPKGKERAEHEKEINTILEKVNVELLVGAGYMHILSPSFVEKFATKTGSKLIGPEADLSKKEKQGLVKGIKTK